MRTTAAMILLVLVAGAAAAAPARRSSGARPATKADTTHVLVRFSDGALTDSDVKRRLEEIPDQFRAQYSTPDGKRMLLERMVEERLWLQAALKAGIAERPDIKAQIERQRRDLLVRTHVNEVMSANPAPTDSDFKAYYDEHLAEYRMPNTVTLSHLLSKTPADAKRVRGWLDKGQNWDDLVKRYSSDTTTRKTGGRLGSVTREGLFQSIGAQPALAESAFALGPGRIGGPYSTSMGYHLIRVESAVSDSVRPFDAVRPMIQRQLANKRQQDYYKSRLDALRQQMKTREDSGAINSFLSARKSAREMFEDAQKAGPASARIEAYKKVLEAYPASDVSPQAQFMVGFVLSEELKEYDQAENAFRSLLERYPKSELVASAKWMLEHMRSEQAPDFMNLESDSARSPATSAKKP